MIRRLVLTAALCLAPIAAYAGSLTITIQSASPAVNATKSYTIPDTDMVKFYGWVQNAYQATPCVPVAPATTCTTTPLTLAQSLLAWANGFMSGTTANVLSYQQQQAASAATTAVAPISAQ